MNSRNALLLTALLAIAARAGAAPDSPKILVVFLKKVIDESEEGRDFVGKLKMQVEEKKANVAKQVTDLQERQNTLMKTEPQARDKKWYEDYRKLLDEITALKAEEQYFVTMLNDQIGRRLNELILGCQEEATKIMKERGAEIVLISRMGKVQIQSDQELQSEIISRRVLCAASPDVDITNEVLKRMNEFYKKNRSKN